MFIRSQFTTGDHQGNGEFVTYFIPAFINYLAILLISHIFKKVSMFFNMKENHETLTMFEDSLINKIFLFNFFNAFNSYFIIAFVKYVSTKNKSTEGLWKYFPQCVWVDSNYKIALRCYEELLGQSWSFFALTFFFNFFDIFWPFLKRCFQKKFFGIPRKYPWGKIDDTIEKEYHKQKFQVTTEVDGVLYDYSEITLQFASLSFFGVVFPLAYALSYITSICEIHMDKLVYMSFIRRPIPRSAADIGNWQYILEGVSFLTIFINSGLVVFTTEAFEELNFIVFAKDRARDIPRFPMQMKYFVFLIFSLLIVKLVLNVLITDTPENLKMILARHQHIIGRTIKKPRDSNANGKSGLPINPSPQNIIDLTEINGQNTVKAKLAGDNKSVISPSVQGKEVEVQGPSIKQQIGFTQDEFRTD
jgi:hypothetical protein